MPVWSHWSQLWRKCTRTPEESFSLLSIFGRVEIFEFYIEDALLLGFNLDLTAGQVDFLQVATIFNLVLLIEPPGLLESSFRFSDALFENHFRFFSQSWLWKQGAF